MLNMAPKPPNCNLGWVGKPCAPGPPVSIWEKWPEGPAARQKRPPAPPAVRQGPPAMESRRARTGARLKPPSCVGRVAGATAAWRARAPGETREQKRSDRQAGRPAGPARHGKPPGADGRPANPPPFRASVVPAGRPPGRPGKQASQNEAKTRQTPSRSRAAASKTKPKQAKTKEKREKPRRTHRKPSEKNTSNRQNTAKPAKKSPPWAPGTCPRELFPGKFPRESSPGKVPRGKFPRESSLGKVPQGKFP